MTTLKSLLNQSKLFFAVQIIALLVLSILLLNFEKQELQRFANSHFSLFFDYIFYVLTHSVEFWGCLVIYILVGIFKNFKFAIIGLLTYASSGLVTQLLKRNVFSEFKRPTVNIDNLRLISDFFDYDQVSNFSFPSGHTTVAFSLFLFLTLIMKNKKWGILFGILACLVAYSRVYLSQHYFIDIFVGSIIGTVITFFSFYGFNKINFGKWATKKIATKK